MYMYSRGQYKKHKTGRSTCTCIVGNTIIGITVPGLSTEIYQCVGHDGGVVNILYCIYMCLRRRSKAILQSVQYSTVHIYMYMCTYMYMIFSGKKERQNVHVFHCNYSTIHLQTQTVHELYITYIHVYSTM